MDDTQRRTPQAGVGALAGAVIGSATGGNAGTGAVLGRRRGCPGHLHLVAKHGAAKARDGTGHARHRHCRVANGGQPADAEHPQRHPFAVGRSDIQPNFAPVLDQFAMGLRNNPYSDVRIVGHTDSTGSDAVNNPCR